MDQVVEQGDSIFMGVGEALALVERYRSEGQLKEAEAICRRILEVQPNLPEAAHLLALIAHQNGKLADAIEHLRCAIKIAPEVALFHANLAEMLRLSGAPERAAEEARRALDIEPDMPLALSNLGVVLYELGKYEDAAQTQRRAIAANPNFADAHTNLGNALYSLKQFDEAISAYNRAIELRPNYADAWANLGTALHHSGRFGEGVTAFRRAIALSPNHANAHSGLGILLLMRGDFAEGWEEYEWRLRSTERKGPRFPQAQWQGENLKGKHIYVQAEQGFGDTLQFVRYIPLLAARAGEVTLRVHQQLVTLLRKSLPAITVLGDRGDPSPYHYDIALLSLPRLFKTRLETIPANVPYLHPPPECVLRWKKRFASMQGVKIGLVWAGNPEHVNDRRRSLDPSALVPLLAMRGVSFVSLQVGRSAAGLKHLEHGQAHIDDLSGELVEFCDTAGAIAALDLVITVDTSVAHLAGALGAPVWTLLSYVNDWRWMLEREDCLWYPTMRLFRRKGEESWSQVIQRVATQVNALTRGDLTPLMPFNAGGERRAAQAAAIIAAENTRGDAPVPAPELTPGHALILAEQKRRHGLLADADELGRQAIGGAPDSAEAAHLLGLVAYQSGKLSEAIEYMRRAVTIRSDVALYYANLGELCRLAGRIDEAIAAGRRALEIHPDHPGALSNLGIALFDQGKFEEALSHYERAIALQEEFAQAHSNRGNALQRLKRFGDAEPAYRRALELQPNFADAWNNLGTCLRELKRAQEAEAAYRKALDLLPNNPDILDNLALALKDLERLDEAGVLLCRALTIEPSNEKIHVHQASVLVDEHKFVEAEAALERALALNPNSHDALNLKGRVAFEAGDLVASLDYFRRALAIKPDLSDAYNNMGNALKELGRLDEARECYVKAIEIDPNGAGVYVNLADSKTFVSGDRHLATMEALSVKTERLSDADRFQLHFALGKAYADLKDYQRSFEHLLAANAGKRATISYDERSALRLFDRIQMAFTSELVAAKSVAGDPSQLPIFIIGMPRSGTTLLEQIIASHPMVHGAGELWTLNEVVLSASEGCGNTILYPEFVSTLDGHRLTQVGARYLAAVRQRAPAGAQRITDKMPSNFYFAGLIHLVLPRAKIIHAIRNPIDTCLSCFSKLFTTEQHYTYSLSELGRYYKQYGRLMEHWRQVLPAGRILDVRYENVVANVEAEARRIIAHCGLEWDERCLAFYRTERPVRTASATQVRLPIYDKAVGRWRDYEPFLSPLLTELED
jgi:tetratricopeptide (TPR) repeat protein